jgi:hypothetical protein
MLGLACVNQLLKFGWGCPAVGGRLGFGSFESCLKPIYAGKVSGNQMSA